MSPSSPPTGRTNLPNITLLITSYRSVDELTLFLFATHLSSSLPSSIKIYLSAVYSMHMDQSLPDHLLGCLGLQRVIYGNKQTQRLTSFTRSPITLNRMLIIHRSLYFDVQDQVMLWATSTRPFGFCPSFRIYSPFSIQHEFNPLLPLTAAATAIASQAATTYLIMSHHQYFQDWPISHRLPHQHWLR